MSNPFIAEIRMVGFNFAPRGYAFCDGQLLPINQFQALFSILGTAFGGDGRTNFALPDLRGRTPVHPEGNLRWGSRGGEESQVLSASEMPPHTHDYNASSDSGSSNFPDDNALAANLPPGSSFLSEPLFTAPGATSTPMADGHIGHTGANQPHNNMQPFLTINFVIALEGTFPSPS